MVLSDEQKDLLRARYETWGLERVRAEVGRDDRSLFADPSVTEFAREWVDSEDARRRRSRQSIAIFAIVGVLQLGVVVALIFVF